MGADISTDASTAALPHPTAQHNATSIASSAPSYALSDPTAADEDIHRGLSNPLGANNCFLNVVVQALWHVRPFQALLLDDTAHVCTGGSGSGTPTSSSSSSCIRCSLTRLLVNYRFTDASSAALRVQEFRGAVSSIGFKVDAMDDANEVLEALLDVLHTTSGTGAAAGSPTGGYFGCKAEARCISHDVFGWCSPRAGACAACGAARVEGIGQHVYRVYIDEIVHVRGGGQATLSQILGDIHFETLARSSNTAPCTVEGCAGECAMDRPLPPVLPQVFVMALVWSTARPPPSTIQAALHVANQCLDLTEILGTGEETEEETEGGASAADGKKEDESSAGAAGGQGNRVVPYDLIGLIAYVLCFEARCN